MEKIHLLLYISFILVIIHSLFLGSDLNIIQNNSIITILSFAVFAAFSLLTILFLIIRFLIKIKGVKR
ncbi:MAG: hypothetical protein MAG795_00251 [Candidatus Woesearchaeota archaeon]|nr:hypothetical protein [Candidatus Woesearchaeota archaeon]